MNKMLQYREPDETDSLKVVRVTAEHAIKFMKDYAYQHGFTYSHDEEALDEFIAVNWAYWVEA